MSCLCKRYDFLTKRPGCPCDEYRHPPEWSIPAGLERLPRQIATFPEFRRAMLAAIRRYPHLAAWRAREEGDLGVMLLEMWAYICDDLSFYDELIAQESYLGTARRRPSLRKLVALLGHLPKPAVGAAATLAAFAEGRQAVKLPRGTAFLSGGFDDEAPQTFELDQETVIHPLANAWEVEAPLRKPELAGLHTLLMDLRAEVKSGTILFLLDPKNPGQNQILRVEKTAPYRSRENRWYTKVTFHSSIKFKDANTPLDRFQVRMPTLSSGIRELRGLFETKKTPLKDVQVTGSEKSKIPTAIPDTSTIIDWGATLSPMPDNTVTESITSPYIGAAWYEVNASANEGAATKKVVDDPLQSLVLRGHVSGIEVGDYVLISRGNDYRWFQVFAVRKGVEKEHKELTIDTKVYKVSGIEIDQTEINLDQPINEKERKNLSAATWDQSVAGELTLHFGLTEAGAIIQETKDGLSSGDPIKLAAPVEEPVPPYQPSRFFLQDKNERGVEIKGKIDYRDRQIDKDPGNRWSPALTLPVQAFGNVLSVSRGKTVEGEVLGSGDASLANQTFKLAKKPLTYLHDPATGSGETVRSTLKIYVDGVQWTEAPNFYRRKPEEQIYILRQNDEEETLVTFGDGRSGQRLPTGLDNVVATYRFGAGAAGPPAGSITQILRPVRGLQAIKNPVAAAGGADRQAPEELRRNAPRSALLLGRAVSIVDMEAAALDVPGVRAARGEWTWNKQQQRALMQIWYVGAAALATKVGESLRRLTDPATPIAVEQAASIPVTLSLEIEIDPRYWPKDVLDAIRDRLLDPKSGWLIPEKQPIGRPFFRSQLFKTLHETPGLIAVRSALWNGQLLTEFARSPADGGYFDFEAGGLELRQYKHPD